MRDPEYLRDIKAALQLMHNTELCGNLFSKLETLLTRLDTQELVVSVFGQFKRGKSSLINTMLGKDILPVGIVPVTSVVTRIKYGKESVFLTSDGSHRQIPMEELYLYVNEQNNPRNQKNVSDVQIEMPSVFLSTGITLVDTPGVGSMHQHNSEAAYAFVKESDAVIFVLSVDSPLNQIECDFLKEIKEFASKIYFAVNKTDLVTPQELTEYVEYCRSIICGIMDTQEIKVYPVSSRDKADSGLHKLKTDITSDVQSFGGDILLASVRTKTTHILKEALGHIRLHISALHMPLNKLEEAVSALQEKLTTLDQISKDTGYLINQRTDALMESLRNAFESEKQRVHAEVLSSLQKTYEEHCHLKPSHLETKLEDTLTSELTVRLFELNNRGLSILKEGYENAAGIFSNNLRSIHEYLSTVIRELFGVDYEFEAEEYLLSEADDFYIKIDFQAPLMLFNKNNLVRILPRVKANRIILESILKSLDDAVSRNLTNMLSNYAYKIRESNRHFKSDFHLKSDELRTGFVAFIERTLSERRSAGGLHEDSILSLQKAYDELSSICDDLAAQ